jgi:3-hydroxyacyl-CoA dehydrogenase
MPLSKSVHRIAVVGTGAGGASWTALFLARGFDVMATDSMPNAEADLRRYVDTVWPALAARGLSPKASPEHLCFSSELGDALADADFVQESVQEYGPERSALKINLFAEIDRATPPDSIIASSSSALTMSVVQSACGHPDRCVIGHTLNPPHIIPLIEVVGGLKTAPEAVQRAMSFYASIGKRPVHVRKEVSGLVANRLQAALFRELAHLIAEDVLDVAAADTAVSWGPGLQWGIMGPSLLSHIAAGPGGMEAFIEQLAGPMASCWNDLGRPELTPKLKQTLIDGAKLEAGDRTVEQLARERDEALLELIHLRRKLNERPSVSARSARTGKRS